MADNKKTCLVVLGPTATGKTALAVALADKFGAEIVSADSRQVYRGLDIGSGKDLNEFAFHRQDGTISNVPYHLIDITDLKTEYSVFNYQKDAYKALNDITARGKTAVLAGGTGMYLDAVLRGYDMIDVPTNVSLRNSLNGVPEEELAKRLIALKGEVHNTTDLTERHRLIRAIEIAEYEKSAEAKAVRAAMPPRPELDYFVIGLTFPRTRLRDGIKKRLLARLDEGMLDEVKRLHEEGAAWERLERLGLEYRFCSEYLQGKFETYQAFVDKLYIAIGQFAKRQETWFRGMERKGCKINWLDTDENTTKDEVFQKAVDLIEKNGIKL
ncbi:MAG: tRNA (adenosine(37)-N6)-dimethylallyltransferase MiaA [Spirochaetaceae bacterium]|nr:tRNA (adenosine(37)-N6)-dimethylallyltransferase MiaA [Spirochaetaceae bacterium]